MTKQKTSSKKQSFVIAILAVLLVGLLAFNITYAFFTDRETNTDEFTFGTINLDTSGQSNVIDVYRTDTEKALNKAMPGDVLKGAFNLALTEDSENAFVRYKLSATPEYRYLFNDNTVDLKTDLGESAGTGYAVVAYINGEFVQATVGGDQSVKVYNGTGVDDEASADSGLTDAIKAYNTFVKFTTSDTIIESVAEEATYKIEFETVGDGNTTGVNAKVTITCTDGDPTEQVLTSASNQADVEAILKEAKNSFDDKAAIKTAVDNLNNALGADNAAATAIPTGFTAPGDGYVYKNDALTSETPVNNVAIKYTLPIGLGNELQGVTINLGLIVEVVQAANVEDVINPETIQTNLGEKYTQFNGYVTGGILTAPAGETNDNAYRAVAMFYAAETAHNGSIEENE